MEAVLIEVRQNNYILNSRSGYNRCLIPRLSVSVGDRVQEEVVKRNDYNETFKYNKISDHFKPKPRRPNDSKDEGKSGPGS